MLVQEFFGNGCGKKVIRKNVSGGNYSFCFDT